MVLNLIWDGTFLHGFKVESTKNVIRIKKDWHHWNANKNDSKMYNFSIDADDFIPNHRAVNTCHQQLVMDVLLQDACRHRCSNPEPSSWETLPNHWLPCYDLSVTMRHRGNLGPSLPTSKCHSGLTHVMACLWLADGCYYCRWLVCDRASDSVFMLFSLSLFPALGDHQTGVQV